MGKVLFSQMYDFSHPWGYPLLYIIILPLVPCPFPGGTPVTGPRSLMGYHSPRQGNPSHRWHTQVPGEGTPVPCGGTPAWGTSVSGGITRFLGYHLARTGLRYPPARTGLGYSSTRTRMGYPLPKTEQQSEYLLCSGWYASFIHAEVLILCSFSVFTVFVPYPRFKHM